METVITQGIQVDDLLSRIGQIVDERVKEAIEAIAPKESPDDLLNYHEVARTYNLSTVSYISNKVCASQVMQFRKDGLVCIRRADAEKLFRKSV